MREIGLELVAGIGADAHEARRSQRQQPGVAGKHVEPDRAERKDQERDHHRVDEEDVAGQRDDDEGDEEDQRQADAILANRKDRHVGGVGRLELAGFAIEHGLPSGCESPLPLAGEG